MKFNGNLTDSNPQTPQRWRGQLRRQQAKAGASQRAMVTSPTGQTSVIIATIHFPIHCRSRSETHLTEKNFDRLVMIVWSFVIPILWQVPGVGWLRPSVWEGAGTQTDGPGTINGKLILLTNNYHLGRLAQDWLRWLVVRAVGEAALQSGQSQNLMWWLVTLIIIIIIGYGYFSEQWTFYLDRVFRAGLQARTFNNWTSGKNRK